MRHALYELVGDVAHLEGREDEHGALLAPMPGTMAASACNSPSIASDGSICLASSVARTTLSTISCLADPFVEKLSIAMRGSNPAIARVVRPVITAI